MKKSLKIYYTSDSHGYLFPVSYHNNEPADTGLLNCISQFQKDDNTLVIDGGDTVQGSPFTKYMWEHPSENCHVTTVLNAGGYDFITLGNHDFNYGYEALRKYLNPLNATCLLANVNDKKGELGILPFVIKQMGNGLKIGIVGVVTDYVSIWENPKNLENLEIADTFTAAKDSLIKIKGLCDITICVYHGGFECDIETGIPRSSNTENVGYKICRELDFDILLTAHQHMAIGYAKLFNTHTMQLSSNATKFAQLDIDCDNGEISVSTKQINAGAIHDTELYNRLLPAQLAVDKWLDTSIGKFSQEILSLDKLTIALQGSMVADFCNRLLLEHTGADFSCTGLSNDLIGIKKEVSIRDIVAAYPFPNTIAVLEVDKGVIKKALERCAEYFSIEDGAITISESFLKPKIEHYNYDFYAGLSYTFDISRPIGERVVEMLHNNKPLEDKTYTLALTNYRATGTGGYVFFRDCKRIMESVKDIQEIAIDYIIENKNILITQKSNYKVIL